MVSSVQGSFMVNQHEPVFGAAAAGLEAAPVVGGQGEGEGAAAGAGGVVEVEFDDGRRQKVVGHDVDLAVAVHVLNSGRVVAAREQVGRAGEVAGIANLVGGELEAGAAARVHVAVHPDIASGAHAAE